MPPQFRVGPTGHHNISVVGFSSYYLLLSMEKIESLSQMWNSSYGFLSKERVSSDLPSDVTIEVNGMSFALHKFPLITRSSRIRKLVEEVNNSDTLRLELRNIPSGVEYFELAAKFCYGINFEITAHNVAQLHCVAEYLQMTEEHGKENLLLRTEVYLDGVVCKSLEMSVETLRQCENLLPLAEELRIVSKCVDAIASKACTEQIASSFSRLEYSSSGRLQTSKKAKDCSSDWWIDDLCVLPIYFYQKVISAMRNRGVRPESIGASIIKYTQKIFAENFGLWSSSNQEKVRGADSAAYERRVLLETLTSLLPTEKLSVPIAFLFKILRTAGSLGCSTACCLEVEKRIGAQLDLATLDNLLIPSFPNAKETMFDVDTVYRILVEFLQQDDSDDESCNAITHESDEAPELSQRALIKVANLIDSYLAEIAPDPNLKLFQFIEIANSMPAHAHALNDGLYTAIDIYLRAHPGMLDLERRKLCKVIDFKRLSPEASAHAAQNDRLPVNSVVEVLYFEQLRLRDAFYRSHFDEAKSITQLSQRSSGGGLSAAMSPRENYTSLRRENRELKLEVARVRMRLSDLEKEHLCIKQCVRRSSPHNMLSSLSRKFTSMSLFSRMRSTRSSSPSKQSQSTDTMNTTVLRRSPSWM